MPICSSSKSWNAHVLATADNYYTSKILGDALGVQPHNTGMVALVPMTKTDHAIWNEQKELYEFALSKQ